MSQLFFADAADAIVPQFVLLVLLATVITGSWSLLIEPARPTYGALLLARARSASPIGDLGLREFVFGAAVTWLAYSGLRGYRGIGIGWLAHVRGLS
jgi:hypothetical protein